MTELSEYDQLKILEEFAKKLTDDMIENPIEFELISINVEELFA
jgi:hypothetical protein